MTELSCGPVVALQEIVQKGGPSGEARDTFGTVSSSVDSQAQETGPSTLSETLTTVSEPNNIVVELVGPIPTTSSEKAETVLQPTSTEVSVNEPAAMIYEATSDSFPQIANSYSLDQAANIDHHLTNTSNQNGNVFLDSFPVNSQELNLATSSFNGHHTSNLLTVFEGNGGIGSHVAAGSNQVVVNHGPVDSGFVFQQERLTTNINAAASTIPTVTPVPVILPTENELPSKKAEPAVQESAYRQPLIDSSGTIPALTLSSENELPSKKAEPAVQESAYRQPPIDSSGTIPEVTSVPFVLPAASELPSVPWEELSVKAIKKSWNVDASDDVLIEEAGGCSSVSSMTSASTVSTSGGTQSDKLYFQMLKQMLVQRYGQRKSMAQIDLLKDIFPTLLMSSNWRKAELKLNILESLMKNQTKDGSSKLAPITID